MRNVQSQTREQHDHGSRMFAGLGHVNGGRSYEDDTGSKRGVNDVHGFSIV